MNTTAIRDAIVAKLAAVADIGRVHAFERYAQNLDDLAAMYATTINGQTQLRGWYLRRVSVSETSPVDGRWVERCGWQIRGYMALADEAQSELVFDSLIDAARDAFRDDAALGGAVTFTRFGDEAGLHLKEAMPVMFAGVLCHAATLTVSTVRYFQQV